MNPSITFEFPLAWHVGLPLAGGLLVWAGLRQRGAGLSITRILGIGALRLAVFSGLLLLASRPVITETTPVGSGARHVVVLLDQSESMSIRDQDQTRFEQAAGFLKNRLIDALRASGLAVETVLFDESTEPASSENLSSAKPDGRRTDLGHAIAHTLATSLRPPTAIVALTDGHANQSTDNARAWSGLSQNRVPLIAVGFGSDQGARSLTLRSAEAPHTVAAKTSFHVSAQLEMINGRNLPPMQLLLLRDGQLLQTKTIDPGAGFRTWLENFTVAEEETGTRNYTVQLLPPDVADLKCANLVANTSVRIEAERELRVLYIQGALTWDYKFVNLALRDDRSMKVTGLSRTSENSMFRQNIEGTGELLNGFPQTIEELAPFRVVVLSNVQARDLTPEQQDLLGRFCAERGGGLLLLGGPDTFDPSWRGSRLEQVLPVTFGTSQAVRDLDRPFHVELTQQALGHPVFRLDEKLAPAASWKRLPSFSSYGRVDAAKPGAEVWGLHPSDEGPGGRRILMAGQRYGAGISAVICIQNFWRWRLAPDLQPETYDRFWRQMFRYLSEAGRPDVSIQFAEQNLQPRSDIHVLLGLEPHPSLAQEDLRKFHVLIEQGRKTVTEQALELRPGQPADFAFRAEDAGLYTVTVLDAAKVPVTSRAVDVRDVNVELQDTARDMENLKQWAAVSEGLALKAEDCPDARDLLEKIRTRLGPLSQQSAQSRPYGITGWTLAGLLGLLAAEWILRKRWGLT